MRIKLAVYAFMAFAMIASAYCQTVIDNFDPNLNAQVYNKSVVVQLDGKIIVVGDFTTANPNGGTTVTRNRIARFNSDGTIDPNFSPSADNTVNVVTLQPDGKILIGGFFTSISGQPRSHIARLNPDGTLDAAFNPNADDLVQAIVLQPDGKILIGGFFKNIGGQAQNSIARINADGTLDGLFNPNPNSTVVALALQSDGKVLVAGPFEIINGQSRKYFVRLNIDGTLDTAFNPNSYYLVDAIMVQSDGKILVGGEFNAVGGTIGGQPRSHIARLISATGLADDWNPNANATVESIVIQSDGKVIAGGGFTTMGGQSRNRFARLDPATGVPDGFNITANNSIKSAALQPDGKLLIAGIFTTLSVDGGSPIVRNRIARVSYNDQNPTPTPTPTVTPTPTPTPSPSPTATPIPVRQRSFNLSTRGFVDTGNRVMIAGFIQDNDATVKVVIRGIGPKLASAGLFDYLVDPTLTLYNSQGNEIYFNDNWQDDPSQADQLRQLGLNPDYPEESAMVVNLPRGLFSAIIRGKNGGVGNALVEFYCLP